MNGPLLVEDNHRFTPGRILVDNNSQVVAHVFQSGAAKEILELERDRRDPDFTTEIDRLISIFLSQLYRSQQYYDLGSYDRSISPYEDGLKPYRSRHWTTQKPATGNSGIGGTSTPVG